MLFPAVTQFNHKLNWACCARSGKTTKRKVTFDWSTQFSHCEWAKIERVEGFDVCSNCACYMDLFTSLLWPFPLFSFLHAIIKTLHVDLFIRTEDLTVSDQGYRRLQRPHNKSFTAGGQWKAAIVKLWQEVLCLYYLNLTAVNCRFRSFLWPQQ